MNRKQCPSARRKILTWFAQARISTIKNFTYHHLCSTSRSSLRLLGYGPKFCPRPEEPKTSVYVSAVNRLTRAIKITDFFEQCEDQGIKEPFRGKSFWCPAECHLTRKCVDACQYIHWQSSLILKKHSSRALRARNNISRALSDIRRDPTIKVTNSDKNLGLVVQDIGAYHQMVRTHLDDQVHYTPICRIDDQARWGPIMEDLQEQRAQLLRAIEPSYHLKQFLLETNCSLPVFHCLPKLHKPGRTGRPIVGATDWITTPFSKYLSSILESVVVTTVLTNSISLLDRIEHATVPADCTLVTYDVSSLYTNMNIDRLIDVVNARTGNPLNGRILEFICRSNYFIYGTQIYYQNDGIAMGTNCAVHCANIYMQYVDEYITELTGTAFYGRYIDDGFWIDTSDDEEYLNEKLEDLSHLIEDIRCTSEVSKTSVNFLDLTIYKRTFEGQCLIACRTYQKPISKYTYLPPSSHHHPATISGFIKGEIIRYLRCNTLLSDRAMMIQLFIYRLLQRGYSREFINNIAVAVDINNRQREIVSSDMSNTHAFVLPFYPSVTTEAYKALGRTINRTLRLSKAVLTVFTKSPNVLELSSRSNISAEQNTILVESAGLLL